MKHLLILALLLLMPVAALAVEKTEPAVYAKADVSNLMRAMLRTGALDATDPLVRDDYLLVHECDLYRENFRDEFKMRRLQEATVKVIEQGRSGWPNAFIFESPLKLDQYDFKEEQYSFEEHSRLVNVNSFALIQNQVAICLPSRMLQRFPNEVGVRLDQPVSIPGIPLTPKEGEALLQRLTSDGKVANKTVYARFSIVVSFMPVMDTLLTANEAKLPRYTFDGRLMQVDFFEDSAMTKLIWTLTR